MKNIEMITEKYVQSQIKNHEIKHSDLFGQYEHILASSGKQQKRLKLVTIITEDLFINTYEVIHQGIRVCNTSDLKKAIKHYNNLF